MRILALDGGNCTGTAYYDNGAVVFGKVGCEGVTVEPIHRRRHAYRFLHALNLLDALAYEQFVIRQALKEDHADVVYINGAVESEGRRREIPVYRYTPGQSKKRVSDDMLKELGWYPGFGLRGGGHAADAARILVCTLQDHYPLEWSKYA